MKEKKYVAEKIENFQAEIPVEEYMKEAKKYEGISISEYKTKFKKEIKAYQDSWIKYQDFKHVKKCGILK